MNQQQLQIKKKINHYLKLCQRRSSSRVISFFSKRFIIFPEVFNPLYAVSSKVLSQNLKINKGAKVLDMGCGTGVLGITSLYEGASNVVFADNNPYAVKNTKENLKLHAFLNKSRVVRSNLFQQLKNEMFDIVLFNSSFVYSHESVSADPLKKSIYDYQYRTLRRFFSNVRTYLKPRGHILFVFSNLGNQEKLNLILREFHFRTNTIFHQRLGVEEWVVYDIHQ